MGLGFSKTEIDSGDYRSDRLMKVLDQYWELEERIQVIRGTRSMELINYVAQAQLSIPVTGIKSNPAIPIISTIPQKPVQLSLF